MNAWKKILATLSSLLLVACQQHTEQQGTAPAYSPDPPELTRVYTLGVHPLYNPQKLAEVFTPLTNYLNQRLPGSTFLLEASKDYADYNNKLRNNVFDFALPNPYQTLLASVSGYRIIAKMAPDDDFRVTRSLDLLRLTTQAFQHGQRDVQAPHLEHSELQQLAQDMNQLFARISEQEQQLNLYKQALDAIPHGVIISDITRPPQPIIYVNQAFTDLTGYYPEQILGRNCNFLQGQDTDPHMIQKIRTAVHQRTGFDGVIMNYKQSGEPFWNSLRISPIVNADGSVSHMVGTETDVTALHDAMDQLQQLAMTDGLTGLSNRRAFHDRINQHLNNPHAREQGCAMVMLDLDGFKPVNDTLGHDAGDKLLRQVAQRIRAHLHPNDLPARLGGDEFAILLTGCRSSTRALQRLDTLSQHLNQPYLLSGEKVENISASIGLAMFPDHGDNADELLRHADQAMYAAKRAGRNRSQIYTPPPVG